MWLSLVERLLWEQDVAGSNPVIPTFNHSTDASVGSRYPAVNRSVVGSTPTCGAFKYASVTELAYVLLLEGRLWRFESSQMHSSISSK